ncbi:MAG TPA: hypothetical protein VMK83_07660 [Gaiellaceae bacterium]|nr:hypothetical protein [Gaiellaceae bacterium]
MTCSHCLARLAPFFTPRGVAFLAGTDTQATRPADEKVSAGSWRGKNRSVQRRKEERMYIGGGLLTLIVIILLLVWLF